MSKTDTTAETMTPYERRKWNECDGIAPFDSKVEEFCSDLERRGLVTCYDSMFGNNYYSLTKTGERAFYGE
jgi:hypothetical protein